MQFFLYSRFYSTNDEGGNKGNEKQLSKTAVFPELIFSTRES